jgi:aspartate/methionine/tyrosine aminotransferase
MNEKQALEIIKAILDLATQKGIFVKMDEAYTAITAFNIVAEKFKDEQDNAVTK